MRQGDVPAAWHGRALRFALVPLGADEVRAVLGEAPPLSGLDDVDATLLRRAVAGDTVAAMARHVQMSTRSVQRRLSALRESFGVGSTAELAATVARQGFSPWHKDDG